MCFQHITNILITIYYSGSSSNTLLFCQQAIQIMHELEFKKVTLELKEKDVTLKEHKFEVKRRELALLKQKKQFLGN